MHATERPDRVQSYCGLPLAHVLTRVCHFHRVTYTRRLKQFQVTQFRNYAIKKKPKVVTYFKRGPIFSLRA